MAEIIWVKALSGFRCLECSRSKTEVKISFTLSIEGRLKSIYSRLIIKSLILAV